MKLPKFTAPALVGALLLGTTFVASPAAAQPASDCGQLANGTGQNFSYVDRGRNDSATYMTGLVNAAISNLKVPVALNALTGNISVVCVTDSLNNNHLEILKGINVDVIDDVAIGQVIGDVNVLAIDTRQSLIYVAPTNFAIGTPQGI